MKEIAVLGNVWGERGKRPGGITWVDGNHCFRYRMVDKEKVPNFLKRWLRSLMPKDEKQEDSEKKAVGEDGVEEKRQGILTGQEIEELKLVDPIGREKKEECLKAASCDLRLGPEVFVCGQKKPKVEKLKKGKPITIESFGSIIFSTKEKILLEERRNIIGRLDLRIGLGLNGLILQVGTQVEPGYKGPLFGLLINTQGTPKTLYEGQRFLTIEFSRISEEPRDDLFKPEEFTNLKEFLKRQSVDSDRLAEPSVIEKVSGELKDCQLRHGLRRSLEDSKFFRKTARYTIWFILITIIIALITFADKVDLYRWRFWRNITVLLDMRDKTLEDMRVNQQNKGEGESETWEAGEIHSATESEPNEIKQGGSEIDELNNKDEEDSHEE